MSSSTRIICPRCKGGPFPSGRNFSIHLSRCTAKETLWDRFPEGVDNYKRLQSEASIPSTLTQRLNEASRDTNRQHLDDNSRNENRLSAMPSISNLAMDPNHHDALAMDFPNEHDSDNFFEQNNDDESINSTGIPDCFNKVLFQCDLPPSILFQIHMEHMLNSHRDVDVSLLDDISNIVKLHVSKGLDMKNSKLYSRQELVNVLVESFNMKQLKPKVVRFPTLNGYVSVPVFDVKSQLLSLLHDPSIMKAENFAEGYDIFTGKTTQEASQYGEVHTGWVFEEARAKFCGNDPDAFPFPLTTFYDKTYVDIHGSLSCAPFIVWPSILNRKSRGQISFARVFCYVPNLGLGKGSSNRCSALQKLNVEHVCLRSVMSQLADIQSAGGFWTVVMGRNVRVVPWLHIASGDIVG